MKSYTKAIYYILLVALLFNCDSNSEDQETSYITIEVTNFSANSDEVTLEWSINNSSNIIVNDLIVYRGEIGYNGSEDLHIIADLPVEHISFLDTEVPYLTTLSYFIKISYYDENDPEMELYYLESDIQNFNRDIIGFDNIPFQIEKDPLEPGIFHLLERSTDLSLKQYNSAQNAITSVKTFEEPYYYTNRFFIKDATQICIADTRGNVHFLQSSNYSVIENIEVVSEDNTHCFFILNDRIFYKDNEAWQYYELNTGTHINTHRTYPHAHRAIALNQGDALFLYNTISYSDALLANYTNDNCNPVDCFPEELHNTYDIDLATNGIDPNIFVWNHSKSKFITSIDGNIFNISDLSLEISLGSITGKQYFQFAFDQNQHIYATVQGEKLIHKFNADYELIETIETRLFPLYPLITPNGLQVISAYTPISYWDYGSGSNYNFNEHCVIESF